MSGNEGTANSSLQRVDSASDQVRADDFTPKIIGIYGLPGAGKSSLLKKLKKTMDRGELYLVDGSAHIAMISGDGEDGGLQVFKKMTADEKRRGRERAIMSIWSLCKTSERHGVVAGHFSFWDDLAKPMDIVWTTADMRTYTHILYLDIEPEKIKQRRIGDPTKDRPSTPVDHLRQWQEAEKERLGKYCFNNGIPYMTINDSTDVEKLITAFVDGDAASGETGATSKVSQWAAQKENLDTVLVIDADKTLAAQDVGQLLCEEMGQADALKDVFGSVLKYSPAAFYQAMLLYESVQEQDWDGLCDKVAQNIHVHAEFVDLLRRAAKKSDVGVVVVTCGIGKVWEKALQKYGLGEAITVVGGGRLDDRIIVTPEIKKDIVRYMQSKKNAFVWAFGDSQLDVEMLKQADQAVVVVCDEETRSKSMDEKLTECITEGGLFARQMLLPSTVKPRLDGKLLAIVHPADIAFEIPLTHTTLHLIHATNRPASKMLAAPTRTREIKGLPLQQAHRHVGYYLATELLPKATGLESYGMISVQGDPTKGHRIRCEDQTVIVSCMRGGDPMAQGVFEALPSAFYVHAHGPADLQNKKHVKALKQAKNILLCDFVINEGKTMLEFIEKIRKDLSKTARIVMMAGVVQAGSVREGGGLENGLKGYSGVSLAALRLSENSYKGAGETDTGSRLFNTEKVEQKE